MLGDKGVARVDLFLIRVAVTLESLERIFLCYQCVLKSLFAFELAVTFFERLS